MRTIIGALFLWPMALAAQTPFEARFDLRYGPFRIAEARIAGQIDTATYSAEGNVRSAGIVDLLRAFHFDLSATGIRPDTAGDDGAFVPDHYVGDADTGRRQVQVVMHYVDHVPVIERIAPNEPARPWSLSPDEQAGTVDPLSAVFRIVYPRADRAPCGWSVEIFDGRRRGELALAAPHVSGDTARCDGQYRRTAGYSPDDMAERDGYALSLEYHRDGAGLWQLHEVVTQTPYGRMRILRQP